MQHSLRIYVHIQIKSKIEFNGAGVQLDSGSVITDQNTGCTSKQKSDLQNKKIKENIMKNRKKMIIFIPSPTWRLNAECNLEVFMWKEIKFKMKSIIWILQSN